MAPPDERFAEGRRRDGDTALGGPERAFPPTRHSAVRALAIGEAEDRRAAADALVRAYWKPCYAYARHRWRLSNDDAKELVQGFFARALEKELFAAFDPARGRFRGFVRACLEHHALHEREAALREKRGGGVRIASLDADEHDVADASEAELDLVFRREWARRLYELAIEGVRARAEELAKPVAFAAFERYDLHDETVAGARPTYAEIATTLAIPETQVTNHLFWARKELRRRLVDELRAVVASEGELADEARWLLGPEEST